MKTIHTSEAWSIREGSDSIGIEANDGETVIARVHLYPESAAWGLCSQTRLRNHQRNRQQRVNARLIAATPDLLEALHATAERLAFMISKYEPSTSPAEDYGDLGIELRLARAAISKAEGRV